jgi:hypothetical protein
MSTAAERVESAASKLTAAELRALRAQLRRELRAEVTAELAAGRARARARKVNEAPEKAAAAARMIRALGKHAACDVDALPLLVELGELVDAELGTAVRTAVAPGNPYGWSWGTVGRVLGMTRQNAHKRFGGARAAVSA